MRDGKKGTGTTCLRQNVASPGFSCESASGKVYINSEQYFDGVRPEVWEFCVGGYQVCEKWLKDRRGRKLSFDDIDHYRRVVVSLGETIKGMCAVDGIIDGHGGWPIE